MKQLAPPLARLRSRAGGWWCARRAGLSLCAVLTLLGSCHPTPPAPQSTPPDHAVLEGVDSRESSRAAGAPGVDAPAGEEDSSVAEATATSSTTAEGPPNAFYDAHLHLTNYVQEGPSAETLLEVMGKQVPRATLFGIPLQQTWSHHNSGDFAPTYYLSSDAPLYYYSFTDAFIARAYERLSKDQQARFDPMITGFNPADMYAADHVRRVLETFPGVFSGVGEFTIHKEFVSPKVAGEIPSLTDPALDRLFAFAAEVGLLVLLHNDIDQPFAKTGEPAVYFEQLKALFARHPKTTIIWAHVGVGRVVRPATEQVQLITSLLEDPAFAHVHFDLSWSEAAKYLQNSPETVQRVARTLKAHPTRFLFGTDEVGPTNPRDYFRVYHMYEPLFAALDDETSYAFRIGNYERLFDTANRRVRAWEKSQGLHVKN